MAIAPPRATGVVALAVGFAGCTCAVRERDVGEDARPAVAAPEKGTLVYPNAPASFVDMVASARHGVVGIRATTPVRSGPAAMFPGAPDAAPDVSIGTGFLIESRGVYVLTNDHIAAGAGELHVVLPDGPEVPVKVIGRDPNLDLALLSIDVPRLHPLTFGDSDQLRVGEWIVVLGNPFGDGVTAAAGIISSTGHDDASLLAGRTLTYHSYLQTDARIHRGNSGGPVLNTVGQVVGVAVVPSDRSPELSFAIPINRVKEIVNALRDNGLVARGWLGALVKPVTRELAQSLELPAVGGAYVTEIKAGSPAARSTLRVGDVIMQWGSAKKVDSRSLPWLVAGTPIGKPIEVVVWRNKAELRLAVITEKMPE